MSKTKTPTKACVLCGSQFSAERPYDHCMAPNCVTAWKQGRRADMAIALLPKSGFTVIFKRDSASMGKTTKG